MEGDEYLDGLLLLGTTASFRSTDNRSPSNSVLGEVELTTDGFIWTVLQGSTRFMNCCGTDDAICLELGLRVVGLELGLRVVELELGLKVVGLELGLRVVGLELGLRVVGLEMGL